MQEAEAATHLFYFGCWGRAGHYWFGAGGHQVGGDQENALSYRFEYIDGGYAPRRWKPGLNMNRKLVDNPDRCFVMEGKTREDRWSITSDTVEYPQGVYLNHHLIYNGELWTLMSWWDRSQGDTRGGCNSSVAACGKHTADMMFVGLCEFFPTVAANLARAQIVLREPELA